MNRSSLAGGLFSAARAAAKCSSALLIEEVVSVAGDSARSERAAISSFLTRIPTKAAAMKMATTMPRSETAILRFKDRSLRDWRQNQTDKRLSKTAC